MAKKDEDIGRPDPEKLRTAAEIIWERPNTKYPAVAEEIGISERQFRKWRKSEMWETAWREVGGDQVQALAPIAKISLKAELLKGNARHAVDILRAAGVMRDATVNINDNRQRDTLRELLSELTPERVYEDESSANL